jgi:hypothetical protein
MSPAINISYRWWKPDAGAERVTEPGGAEVEFADEMGHTRERLLLKISEARYLTRSRCRLV